MSHDCAVRFAKLCHTRGLLVLFLYSARLLGGQNPDKLNLEVGEIPLDPFALSYDYASGSGTATVAGNSTVPYRISCGTESYHAVCGYARIHTQPKTV